MGDFVPFSINGSFNNPIISLNATGQPHIFAPIIPPTKQITRNDAIITNPNNVFACEKRSRTTASFCVKNIYDIPCLNKS